MTRLKLKLSFNFQSNTTITIETVAINVAMGVMTTPCEGNRVKIVKKYLKYQKFFEHPLKVYEST